MGTQAVDFEQLSTSEKILRLQEQWDRIAENPDEVEVTEAQKAISSLNSTLMNGRTLIVSEAKPQESRTGGGYGGGSSGRY